MKKVFKTLFHTIARKESRSYFMNCIINKIANDIKSSLYINWMVMSHKMHTINLMVSYIRLVDLWTNMKFLYSNIGIN